MDDVRLPGLQPGMLVVDLGCGEGALALLAAKQVGPSGRVFGVDVAPAMIERARVAASGAGLGNVEFRLGALEDIPLDDAIADVVVSSYAFSLVREKEKAFREAYRVLRPGGMLAVTDLVALREVPAVLAADPGGFSARIAGAVSLECYAGLIQAAGFMRPVVRELEALTPQQVAALVEADMRRPAGSMPAAMEYRDFDGCIASARIQTLKVATCCG